MRSVLNECRRSSVSWTIEETMLLLKMFLVYKSSKLEAGEDWKLSTLNIMMVYNCS